MLIGTHTEQEQIGARKFHMTQHIKPIAYHDSQGQLQRITNALAQTGNPTVPIGVDELVQFRIRSKLTGNAPVVYFGKGQTNVRYTPLDTNNVDGIVDGNSITFHEAWGNADLKLTVGGHRLQKDIILRSGHPQTFAFRIDDHEGFDPVTLQTEDFKIYPPFLYEPESPIRTHLSWLVSEEGGKTILTVVLPPGDHAGKILDPTFGPVQPDAADGYDTWLWNDNPDFNFGANTGLWCGDLVGATGITRSLIKFDLSSLPSNAVISSTTLSLYLQTNDASNVRTLRVYRQKRAWVEGTNVGSGAGTTGATWDNYETSTPTAWQTAGGFGANDCEQTDIGSLSFAAAATLGQFYDFDLSPTTKSGLDLGNGWMIKADTESEDAHHFYSSDYETAANRPKLEIEYTLPVKNGIAEIESIASIACAGNRLADGSAAVNSISSLVLDGDRIAAALASITSIALLSADPLRSRQGLAAIQSIASLVSDGDRVAAAIAAINSAASLSADGDRTASGIAGIASVASLIADGDRVASAIASIAASAAVASQAYKKLYAIAGISSAASLAIDADRIASAIVAINSISSLIADATGGAVVYGIAAIQSIAELAIDGNFIASGTSEIGSEASLAADGYRLASAIASLQSIASVDADPTRIQQAIAVIDSVSLLDIEAWRRMFGATDIDSVSSMAVTGDVFKLAAVAISSIASLALDGNRIALAIAVINVISSLFVDADETSAAIVGIIAVTSLVASGVKVAHGEITIAAVSSADLAAIAYITQSFGYTGTLTAGDVLVIDTAAMTVKLNGSNVRELMTGTFPKLYEGTNELRWKDGGEVPDLDFETAHEPRYL